MHIHTFRAFYPNFDMITDPDTFFATVKYDFAEYLSAGFFHEASENALYICEIHSGASVHTGVVASVDIEDYLNECILRHENTLTATETHLTEILVQRKAMIKPVLLTYKPNKKINKLIGKGKQREPVFSVYFAQEKRKHVYYKISEPALVKEFEKAWAEEVHKAYIADGHHRCAVNTTLYRAMQKKPQAAKQYRYLLCMFFASDQLVIHEYNRIVDMEGEMTPTMFLAKLSTLCDVEALKKADKPRKKHEMTLYLNREWYRLRWKKKVLKVYSKELVVVDADILNKEVLNNILAIKDVRNDARLSYVDGLSGVAGITEKTEKSAYRIGFCLYPLSYKDITKVADAGKTLPPKSTWFEPRVKNGVISQLI